MRLMALMPPAPWRGGRAGFGVGALCGWRKRRRRNWPGAVRVLAGRVFAPVRRGATLHEIGPDQPGDGKGSFDDAVGVMRPAQQQAAVAAGSMLVVATDVVQAPNDKQQIEPTLDKLGALPPALGETETLLADAGYFGGPNVEACENAGAGEPLIAMGRQPHHPPLAERFEKTPEAPENPTPVEAMTHRLKTPEGRNLYALRKQTPEPVFGIIKSVLGFREFSMRGLERARGERSLRDHRLEHQANGSPQPRVRRAEMRLKAFARAPPGDFTATAEVDNTANRTEKVKISPTAKAQTSVRQAARRCTCTRGAVAKRTR